MQILDIAGPLEVFAHSPGYNITIATPDTTHLLQTNRGFALTNAVPLNQITGKIDTLLVTGGPGAESGTYDPAYLTWIAEASTRSRRVASICTGAFPSPPPASSTTARPSPTGTSATVSPASSPPSTSSPTPFTSATAPSTPPPASPPAST
ncbi:DJ-1/PfpI family protein [Tunturiibacter gelidiferens]|uniref:DJ-1/PfpI family protein n=1 Tax=Tunturiibacter gelidiferens TaxID=3069689 RepID=UPI003D9B1162